MMVSTKSFSASVVGARPRRPTPMKLTMGLIKIRCVLAVRIVKPYNGSLLKIRLRRAGQLRGESGFLCDDCHNHYGSC